MKNSLPFFLFIVNYFSYAVPSNMNLCFGLWSRKLDSNLFFLELKKNPSEENVLKELFRNWFFVSGLNEIDQNCFEIIATLTQSVLSYQDSSLNFYWNQLFKLSTIWFFFLRKNFIFDELETWNFYCLLTMIFFPKNNLVKKNHCKLLRLKISQYIWPLKIKFEHYLLIYVYAFLSFYYLYLETKFLKTNFESKNFHEKVKERKKFILISLGSGCGKNRESRPSHYKSGLSER